MSKSFQIWDRFFPLLFPKDSKKLTSLDIGLLEVVVKRPLNGVRNNNTKKILLSKAKFAQKQTFFARRFYIEFIVNIWKTSIKKSILLRQFYTLYNQKFSNLRPLLFITLPQGFWKSKKIGHWTLGSGGKNTVKQSEKHQYKKIPHTGDKASLDRCV